MKEDTKPAALSAHLEKVRDRFAIWRSRKKPGSRIPKALWEAAIQSCKSDSVLHVSKALQLNYNELKERVRASGEMDTPVPKNQSSTFVELGLMASSSGLTLELEAPNGAKMKLQYEGPIDPLAFCEMFWRQGS